MPSCSTPSTVTWIWHRVNPPPPPPPHYPIAFLSRPVATSSPQSSRTTVEHFQRKEDGERAHDSSISSRIQRSVPARAQETGGEIFAFNMSSNLLSPFLTCSPTSSPTQKYHCANHQRGSPVHTAVLLSKYVFFLKTKKRHVVCPLGRFIKPEHCVIVIMIILKHWRSWNNWERKIKCGIPAFELRAAKSFNQRRPRSTWTASGETGDNESLLAAS